MHIFRKQNHVSQNVYNIIYYNKCLFIFFWVIVLD